MKVELIFRDYYQDRQRRREKIRDILFIIFCVVLTFWVCGCRDYAWADVVDMKIIAQIESSGNPNAVSSVGAIGLYQITTICLKEFNQFNKTHYLQKDLFSPAVNEKVAWWYLNIRIPQMLKYYCKPVTTENCLIAYNAGIRAVIRGYLPKETANYLKKYVRLSNANS